MIAAEPLATANSAEIDAQHLIRLLHGVIRELMMVDDAAADLPLRQFRVCMLLFDRPCSMSEISREMGMSSSATSQIADRLEQAGLVKRQATDNDRRIRNLQLTSRGETLMRSREEVRRQRTAKVLERLTPEQRQQTLTALQTLMTFTGGELPPRPKAPANSHPVPLRKVPAGER